MDTDTIVVPDLLYADTFAGWQLDASRRADGMVTIGTRDPEGRARSVAVHETVLVEVLQAVASWPAEEPAPIPHKSHPGWRLVRWLAGAGLWLVLAAAFAMVLAR